MGPGTIAGQPNLLLQTTWIAVNTLRWQGGWLIWFAVTLSFAWSYYALGRHLDSTHSWRSLAFGIVLIAASADLIGVLVKIVV